MFTLEELRQENQEILNLCEVLSVLIEYEKLRDNPIVCELVDKFRDKVWTHLVFEDNPIYAELARHHDNEISDVASHFLQSSQEIKKRFANYIKCWCRPTEDHDQFVSESHEIMRLIINRVKYENDKIFPLIANRQ